MDTEADSALVAIDRVGHEIIDALAPQTAVLDSNGTIIATNRAWDRFGGQSSGETSAPGSRTGVGADYLATCLTSASLGCAEAAAAATGIRSVLDGDVPDFTLEYPCHAPDRAYWYMLRVAALRDGGAGALVTHTDISPMREAADARDRLSELLIDAQKSELIGNLSAGIAHDFNNILAIIAGHAKIASEEVPANSTDLASSIGEIRKACERAGELTNQILSFARHKKIDLQSIHPATIVQESARFLRSVLPARVSLTVHCASAVPRVLADATLIEQVILNLAKNATDAAGGRAVHIDIRLEEPSEEEVPAQVRSNLLAEMVDGAHRMVRIAVVDDGPGIAPDIINRIFDPLFTTKAVGSGTGLGLSVVKAIMQMHHGDIVVDSRLGSGATFSAYLPVDTQPAGTFPPSRDAAQGANPKIGRGRRVMYLDDEESLVLLVCNMLENEGYRASGYSKIDDAIAALRDAAAPVDAFVTDFNMPGMSGLEVARQVRAMNATVPILLASGFLEPGVAEHARSAGICRVVSKANIVQLGLQIELALSRR